MTEPLSSEDVKTMAHLARIGLDAESIEPLRQELTTMLDLVAQLQAVDTTGVDPMAHPLDASLRLRDDVVSEPAQRERLQAPAPEIEQGFFLVPRVIE